MIDNIPEFYESDQEWESGEWANLKVQKDRIEKEQDAPIQQALAVLQEAVDFNFLSVLDARPTPEARERYTDLMVRMCLALRATLNARER